MREKDWNGCECPVGEPDDTIIKVWNISPHVDPDYDHCVVRSYQDAMEFVKSVAVNESESDETPTAEAPLVIKVWVSEMRLGDYRELLQRTC